MKKHKQNTWIEKFQEKLDQRFGKGIYKAAVILFLFGSLSLVSCKPDSKEARVPTFPTTETPSPSAPAPPNKITITNTKQTATINNLVELYEDYPVVIDAYFAKKTCEQIENINGKEVTIADLEQIKTATLYEEVYVVVDTFNLSGKNIELKILDKDGIITEKEYEAIPFQKLVIGEDGKNKTEDVEGIFTSKVNQLNSNGQNEYAIFYINLTAQESTTTNDWTKKINKNKSLFRDHCI